jgi:hypothetical protein
MRYRAAALLATILAAVAVFALVCLTDVSTDAVVSFFIYASSVPVFLFPAIYFVAAPWWESGTGRWLMLQSSSLASVMALVDAATFFGPDYPGRPYLRIVVYGLLFVAFCLGVVVLIANQVRGRRDRRALL